MEFEWVGQGPDQGYLLWCEEEGKEVWGEKEEGGRRKKSGGKREEGGKREGGLKREESGEK